MKTVNRKLELTVVLRRVGASERKSPKVTLVRQALSPVLRSEG